MLYGSCIHAMVDGRLKGTATPEADAATCKKWGVEDVKGAVVHADIALACLRAWCAGDNPMGVKFEVLFSEVPLATHVGKWRTRVTGFEEADHVYELREGEVAGTFDILLGSLDGEWRVVVDLKTGSYGTWTMPAVLGQMKTLVAQCRVKREWAAPKWAAAILHSQAGLPPVMYCSDDIPKADSKKHLALVSDAMKRVGDGSLRPGAWCMKCSAREGCPANDGALLARSGAMVKMSTAELMKEAVEPGQLHMFLQQFDALAKRARAALRAEVERGALVIRPDGKVLVIREMMVERGLSKKGIVAALGKVEGEKLLDELRAKGVLEEVAEQRMVAVDGDK